MTLVYHHASSNFAPHQAWIPPNQLLAQPGLTWSNSTTPHDMAYQPNYGFTPPFNGNTQFHERQSPIPVPFANPGLFYAAVGPAMADPRLAPATTNRDFTTTANVNMLQFVYEQSLAYTRQLEAQLRSMQANFAALTQHLHAQQDAQQMPGAQPAARQPSAHTPSQQVQRPPQQSRSTTPEEHPNGGPTSTATPDRARTRSANWRSQRVQYFTYNGAPHIKLILEGPGARRSNAIPDIASMERIIAKLAPSWSNSILQIEDCGRAKFLLVVKKEKGRSPSTTRYFLSRLLKKANMYPRLWTSKHASTLAAHTSAQSQATSQLQPTQAFTASASSATAAAATTASSANQETATVPSATAPPTVAAASAPTPTQPTVTAMPATPAAPRPAAEDSAPPTEAPPTESISVPVPAASSTPAGSSILVRAPAKAAMAATELRRSPRLSSN